MFVSVDFLLVLLLSSVASGSASLWAQDTHLSHTLVALHSRYVDFLLSGAIQALKLHCFFGDFFNTIIIIIISTNVISN